jgi:hypothetical protein
MSIKPFERKIHHKLVKDYKIQLRNFIITSRFNNKTWNENIYFRSKHNITGCIYCSPSPVTHTIPNESILFILEMNNETNQIIGVGMVRNHPYINKYNVYGNGNYNRYVFIGKHRIDRIDMTPEEDIIMQVFDILCFTGNRHMKRGQGLKSFPLDMLFRCNKRLDLVDFIAKMFKSRLNSII